ncbi:MAG: DUF3881 family protein [Lachnospiraceae bacterium]|nr:DUF3881 family protein [Lachnospiraceae bacterium]
MHSYLRAIGFSNIQSHIELDKLFGVVMTTPNSINKVAINNNSTFAHFTKEFSDSCGLSIIGSYDEKGFFHMNHYFPYCTGTTVSSKESVTINKRIDTDSYTGMCDDMRLGVSLIFYLLNISDYMRSNISYGTGRVVDINLSALSTKGSVLLGIKYDNNQRRKNNADEARRGKLIHEAKMGNQDAIDSLTIEELDDYAMVTRRSKVEDIYTIVNSSFIPFGSESDNYTILGTIINWNTFHNSLTNEQLYRLTINCNGLIFPVYINANDLMGEPMIGRRFKGNIWLQGTIDFTEL